MTAELLWVQAKVDQLLAHVREMSPVSNPFAGIDLVMIPLSEPPENATKKELELWERTCDNCGAWCAPATGMFYTGYVNREVLGSMIAITFGACKDCAKLEVSDG